MQLCPDCDEIISSESINIQEGFALCPACGRLTRLSELSFRNRSIVETLNQPPAGCSIVPVGHGVTVRASLRSLTGFFVATGIALFWNGIVSVFVLIAIAGLYANLVGPLPAWFPAPGVKNGNPQMNGGPMGLGETLFLCVCLIPFVTVGTVMIGAAFMSLFGKVVVVVDEFNSYAATGIGLFVWKKRFDPLQVHSISISTKTSVSDSQTSTSRSIEIQSDRTVKFGTMLQSDQLEWMHAALKELMLKSSASRTKTGLPVLTWIPRREK